MRQQTLITIALCVVSVLCTAGIIYLTPLKWITVIPPTIHDIDPKAFAAEFNADPEKFMFIDVRPPSAYEKQHAIGAVNMPLQTLYDLRPALPKYGKEIVLICSGGQASGVGYSYLQHYGFFNIRRVSGGIENWILEGMPVESGPSR